MNVQEAELPLSRRRHARLQFPDDQTGTIRIVAIGQAALSSPPGRVRLRDVSEGGCGFYSELRFPAHPRVRVEIAWTFEGRTMALEGRIVWRLPAEGGYRYGLQFQPTPAQRSELIGHLNRLLVSLCPGQTKIHALYRKMLAKPYSHRNEEAPP